MFAAIRGAAAARASTRERTGDAAGSGRRVLLIDHEDSFVHTLANYIRTTGAEVVTMRPDLARAELRRGVDADLVVLSPGPGRPSDFAMAETLDLIMRRHLPVFGVCLGLQGIVEYFGGTLAVLDVPMHGKPSLVRVIGGGVFDGMPQDFIVGRYHSLHAGVGTLPPELAVTAETEDGDRDGGRASAPADCRCPVPPGIGDDPASGDRTCRSSPRSSRPSPRSRSIR